MNQESIRDMLILRDLIGLAMAEAAGRQTELQQPAARLNTPAESGAENDSLEWLLARVTSLLESVPDPSAGGPQDGRRPSASQSSHWPMPRPTSSSSSSTPKKPSAG